MLWLKILKTWLMWHMPPFLFFYGVFFGFISYFPTLLSRVDICYVQCFDYCLSFYVIQSQAQSLGFHFVLFSHAIWFHCECLLHWLRSLKLCCSLSSLSESEHRPDALDGGTGRLFACSGPCHGGHPQPHRTIGRKQCKNHNSVNFG